MVSENFKTLKDLYIRVLPALKSKVKELKDKNILFVTEEDIWNYLKNNEWDSKTDLTLFDVVNDILFLKDEIIINYLNKLKYNKTSPNKKEEEDIL